MLLGVIVIGGQVSLLKLQAYRNGLMKVDMASLTGEKHAMCVQLPPKYLQKDADEHTRCQLKTIIF